MRDPAAEIALQPFSLESLTSVLPMSADNEGAREYAQGFFVGHFDHEERMIEVTEPESTNESLFSTTVETSPMFWTGFMDVKALLWMAGRHHVPTFRFSSRPAVVAAYVNFLIFEDGYADKRNPRAQDPNPLTEDEIALLRVQSRNKTFSITGELCQKAVWLTWRRACYDNQVGVARNRDIVNEILHGWVRPSMRTK